MRKRVGRRAFLGGASAALAPAVAGCTTTADVLGLRPAVRVAVSWSATELGAFRSVVAGLQQLPGFGPMDYAVELIPLGDHIGAALGARGTGRPDVVLLPQPGLVAEHLGELEPVPAGLWSTPQGADAYADTWRRLLFHPHPEHGGAVPYGVPFKAAHKSAVWYRRSLLDEHGLAPPATWSEWLQLNEELTARGVPALALGAADGWTLTDFFENVLLAGSPCAYDELTGPAPRPWGSPAVRSALRQLGRMWSAPGVLAGGVDGSLVRQFPDAVLQVFGYRRAAMVVVPDFGELYVHRFRAPDEEVGVAAFPAFDGDGRAPLVAGGDVAVLPRPSLPEARDFVRRLAHPSAPLPWITGVGGFLAANRRTPRGQYSAELSELADQLHAAPFRFDLSDQIGAVGGSEGLWRVLLDFLGAVGDGHPERVEGAVDDAVDRLRAVEDQDVGAAGRSTRDAVRADVARRIARCERERDGG